MLDFLPMDLSPGWDIPKFTRGEILRQPQVPKMLHLVNPRTVLGATWWNKTRQVAYATNNYCCWACGVHKSRSYRYRLEAHESYTIDYREGLAELREVQALCSLCHGFIHMGRTNALWSKREISTRLYLDTVVHGYWILAQAGLKPWPHTREIFEPDYTPESEPAIAPWGKWRMKIGDRLYQSPFKSFAEWERYFNHG